MVICHLLTVILSLSISYQQLCLIRTLHFTFSACHFPQGIHVRYPIAPASLACVAPSAVISVRFALPLLQFLVRKPSPILAGTALVCCTYS